MITKTRLSLLEQRLLVRRENYEMNNENVAHQREVIGWILKGIRQTDDAEYVSFREVIVKTIFNKQGAEQNKEKSFKQFDDFYFNDLTTEERIDFVFEVLFGSVLPKNYEFKMLPKFVDFISKVRHNTDVAHNS